MLAVEVVVEVVEEVAEKVVVKSYQTLIGAKHYQVSAEEYSIVC